MPRELQAQITIVNTHDTENYTARMTFGRMLSTHRQCLADETDVNHQNLENPKHSIGLGYPNVTIELDQKSTEEEKVEAIKIERKKKILYKFVGPMAFLSGFAVIGIGIAAHEKKHQTKLLWIATLLMILDFISFIFLWIFVNKISTSLRWLVKLEILLYVTLVILAAALVIGVIGVR